MSGIGSVILESSVGVKVIVACIIVIYIKTTLHKPFLGLIPSLTMSSRYACSFIFKSGQSYSGAENWGTPRLPHN